MKEHQLYSKFKEKCPGLLQGNYSCKFKKGSKKNSLKLLINEQQAYIFTYNTDNDWILEQILVKEFYWRN